MTGHKSMHKTLLSTLLLMVLSCSGNPTSDAAQKHSLIVHENNQPVIAAPARELRVATLNIAHGRGQSLNQLLVAEASMKTNLGQIARFLRTKNVHIAALQEVDAPSIWSGNIDQARFLAEAAGYGWWGQASHASLGIADYGTAVLSAVPMRGALGLDFPPSPPTAQKGFTLAEIEWTPEMGTQITLDVISIHMDFSRKSVRRQQMEELDKIMKERSNPLVLMGDFNSESLAATLMKRAADSERHLHTWTDDQSEHFTYKQKRLDWIIVSGDLEIIDYTTADDPLSDHKAVIADLRLVK